MKTKPTKKAYQIDFNRIEEGYLWPECVCHAETVGEAKSMLLGEVEDAKQCYTGEEITFLNIPVIRRKESDLYEFEGNNVTLCGIKEIEQERKRLYKLNSILNDPSITHAYIKKGSYYRPGSCGYTDFKHRAGVYTKEEAVSHAKSCQDILVEVIDIYEHNKMLNEMIAELKTRIL